MAEYYRQAAKVTQELAAYVASVNRAAIHDHPRVTTPKGNSRLMCED